MVIMTYYNILMLKYPQIQFQSISLLKILLVDIPQTLLGLACYVC